jgi:hypothetical protein
MKPFLSVIVLVSVVLPFASGATCTDGADCFCDSVAAPAGSSILMCEDFEDAAYYELVPGHWVDNGPGEERGYDSLWHQKYGPANRGMWRDGDPGSNPRVGDTCNVTGGSYCNGLMEYCSEQQGNLVDGNGADCWEANGRGAAIDIMRRGDADAEISSLSDPRYPGGEGTPGGRQWYAARQHPVDLEYGIRGGRSLPNPTSIGITQLYAFPENTPTSGILGAALKFNEFGPRDSQALIGFASSPPGLQPHFPYQGFITPSSGCSQSIVDGLTPGLETGTLMGVFKCDTRFRWHGEDSGVERYNQALDWPFGTWGCYRSRVSGLDTNNVCVTQWFGNGSDEKVVIDFCGLDGTRLETSNGITGMSWNFYSNSISGGGGVETAYRYEDNFVITDGEPVSCDALFENATPATSPPTAPILLP